MQRRLYFVLNRYTRQRHRRHNWGHFVRILACVVVFCTTYALILPAITMEKTVCKIEEHTHTEECTGETLVCELTTQPHNHTDNCYQTNLVCLLPETEGHSHDDGCYESVQVCQLAEEEAHFHGDECYEQIPVINCIPEAETVLICTEPVAIKHIHDESCFVTAAVEEDPLTCTLTEAKTIPTLTGATAPGN